jgi:hypothetical protein
MHQPAHRRGLVLETLEPVVVGAVLEVVVGEVDHEPERCKLAG